MSSVKAATHKVLMAKYVECGLDTAIEIARNALRQHPKNHTYDSIEGFHADLSGEICETVLEILLKEYCLRNPGRTQHWFWDKGVILSNHDSYKSKFLTEVDMILFTPGCIFLFECKSYSGRKQLVNKGLLQRDVGNSCDVYKQSSLHLEAVQSWFGKLSSKPRFSLVFFDFSIGELVDKRKAEDKACLLYTNEKNLYKLLDVQLEPVWDTSTLHRIHTVLERQTESLRQRHLDYVKSLRKGDSVE